MPFVCLFPGTPKKQANPRTEFARKKRLRNQAECYKRALIAFEASS